MLTQWHSSHNVREMLQHTADNTLVARLQKIAFDHPDWRLAQAAREVGYSTGHVSRVAARAGIKFATEGPYGRRSESPMPMPGPLIVAPVAPLQVSDMQLQEAIYKLMDTEQFRETIYQVLSTRASGLVVGALHRDNARVLVEALRVARSPRPGEDPRARALDRLIAMSGVDGADAWDVFLRWLDRDGRKAFAEWMAAALGKLAEAARENTSG